MWSHNICMNLFVSNDLSSWDIKYMHFRQNQERPKFIQLDSRRRLVLWMAISFHVITLLDGVDIIIKLYFVFPFSFSLDGISLNY